VALRLLGLASTVVRAYGGLEGIDAARTCRPDLIVLDLMMPDVNGFEVVEVLHKHPDTAQIPIVVVTAMPLTDEDRIKLTGYVTAIIDKSEVDDRRFIAEVKRAMSGRELAA
jgi:CheY-like chemotaxis protein